MSHISLQPVGGYWLAIAMAAALLLLLVIVPPRRATTPRRRLVLIGLRLAVFAMVITAMLRPARIITEVKHQSATLVLLLDRSRSMLVDDSFGGKSRWETLTELCNTAARQLRQLAEDLEVKIYTFDDDLHSVEFSPDQTAQDRIDLGDAPHGDETAVGWAMEEILRLEAGKRLAGVVLASDGAQRAFAPRDTPPQSAARHLADLGCPLYTLVFGEARGLGQARDLALEDLIASQTVYVKNQLDVAGTLRIEGYAGKPLAVQLEFETAPGKMETVAAAELLAKQDGQQLPVRLSHVPQAPGEYKLTLQAAQQEGELVTTNNHLSTFVTVLKGGINALYLEGDLRPDQRFLRAALDASPNVKLDFQWIDSRTRSRWPVDLGDHFQPGKYDVYFIGDLDSTALSADAWQALAERIDAGAGLAMLGGRQSFGPGGYQSTPLVDVLPVVMGRLERQRFEDPISRDLHLEGPLKIKPAEPLGVGHPVMQLAAEEENMLAWSKLPPLRGANRLVPKPANALVLAQSDDARQAPLVIVGSAGNGRVLAFAGDTTWDWPMQGFDKQHKRFWRQVVLWLAKKDQATEGQVWIQLDQRRYSPGSRVSFNVGANSPAGEPVAQATFRVQIIGPDGKQQTVGLSPREQHQAGSFFNTRAPGDYTISVTARGGDTPLGTASARFLVFQQDLELDHPAAEPGLLASLAQMTAEFGGEALAPEEFSDLLNRLQEKSLELEVETQNKKNYWDTWPFFLALVALLSVEWLLRKKWGLV